MEVRMMKDQLIHLTSLVFVVVNMFVFASQSSAQTVAPPQQSSAVKIDSRIRISWGGGDSRKWQGAIRFHDAEIKNWRLLGMNIESPAALNFEKHSINVNQLVASTFEGVDLDVSGDSLSQISFRFLSDSGDVVEHQMRCLLYTSPSPRDATLSRMPSSA